MARAGETLGMRFAGLALFHRFTFSSASPPARHLVLLEPLASLMQAQKIPGSPFTYTLRSPLLYREVPSDIPGSPLFKSGIHNPLCKSYPSNSFRSYSGNISRSEAGYAQPRWPSAADGQTVRTHSPGKLEMYKAGPLSPTLYILAFGSVSRDKWNNLCHSSDVNSLAVNYGMVREGLGA